MNTFVLNPPIFIRKLSLNLSLKFFWVSGLIFMLFLLAFYIFQVSVLSLESYQALNYQKMLAKLSQENKALEINLVKINSLENIEPKIKELGFEKIDKIHYLQVLETPILTKK